MHWNKYQIAAVVILFIFSLICASIVHDAQKRARNRADEHMSNGTAIVVFIIFWLIGIWIAIVFFVDKKPKSDAPAFPVQTINGIKFHSPPPSGK